MRFTFALSLFVLCASRASAQGIAEYNMTRKLQVCTASIQNFGARCDGAAHPEFEHEEAPIGPVPNGGWCQSEDQDFCGYDVDVWRCESQFLWHCSSSACFHTSGTSTMVSPRLALQHAKYSTTDSFHFVHFVHVSSPGSLDFHYLCAVVASAC